LWCINEIKQNLPSIPGNPTMVFIDFSIHHLNLLSYLTMGLTYAGVYHIFEPQEEKYGPNILAAYSRKASLNF
jgi:hypothetical protein